MTTKHDALTPLVDLGNKSGGIIAGIKVKFVIETHKSISDRVKSIGPTRCGPLKAKWQQNLRSHWSESLHGKQETEVYKG